MFAFAIWDRAARELFLVRDRFGVKPLYYVHLEDGTLIFGSEIKAILASGEVRAALNLNAAAGLRWPTMRHRARRRCSRAIKRLAAGHTLTWRDGRVEIRRYWDLHFGTVELDGQSRRRAHRGVPASASARRCACGSWPTCR